MSNSVKCDLCPKRCVVPPGKSGDCRIRVNIDGTLLAVTYGHPCAMHVDPVEKKPLNHFLPGTRAFSIATAGCNLHCRNCQNWQISQASADTTRAYSVTPAQLCNLAASNYCASIAYTYTDPAVFYEYTLACSRAACEKDIKNIMVTAGYINPKPFKELCKYLHAANIDLKAFSDKFYREVCGGTLKPVLNTLVNAKEAGIELEVTNLILPTLNDSDKDITALCRWIKLELGAETPLHFSKFSPRYRMRNLPPTPEKTLKRARQIAVAEGLKYVYVGNILDTRWQSTVCPKCGKLLIKRVGYRIREQHIVNGKCPDCGTKIYGVWK